MGAWSKQGRWKISLITINWGSGINEIGGKFIDSELTGVDG